MERFEGTEVFKSIVLQGDFTPNSVIDLRVEMEQPYEVPVWISCRYEDTDITDEERRIQFNERTISVYENTFEPGPGITSEESNPHVVEFGFQVPEPGDYFIACFTGAAPEHGIGQGFSIREAGGG